MTRRFDRIPGIGKLHMQSFCAMQHYDFAEINSFSYEQLFQTLRLLRLPYGEAEQLFRRMSFNVLARNCDDHTKNFSFIMDKKGSWKLAPAFDVCHAYRPGSSWVSRQSLSVNGKRENIKGSDLIEVAKQMNIKKAGAIVESISREIEQWLKYAESQNVPNDLANAIKTTLLSP